MIISDTTLCQSQALHDLSTQLISQTGGNHYHRGVNNHISYHSLQYAPKECDGIHWLEAGVESRKVLFMLFPSETGRNGHPATNKIHKYLGHAFYRQSCIIFGKNAKQTDR